MNINYGTLLELHFLTENRPFYYSVKIPDEKSYPYSLQTNDFTRNFMWHAPPNEQTAERVCRKESSRFWDYLGKMCEFHVPLYNWRMTLGDEIDFDIFQQKFLIPTDNYAEMIECPKACRSACSRRVINQYRGGYEAVCRENILDSFPLADNDALIYKVKETALQKAIAEALKIAWDGSSVCTFEDTWWLGKYSTDNGQSIPVYFTMRNWEDEVIDVILNLNWHCPNKYVLLGMNRKILDSNCERLLNEHGAKFIPLNETLDFNNNAEFYLLQPIQIKEAAVQA